MLKKYFWCWRNIFDVEEIFLMLKKYFVGQHWQKLGVVYYMQNRLGQLNTPTAHLYERKFKQPRPGFEFDLPCPFSTMVTFTLQSPPPPTQYMIQKSLYWMKISGRSLHEVVHYVNIILCVNLRHTNIEDSSVLPILVLKKLNDASIKAIFFFVFFFFFFFCEDYFRTLNIPWKVGERRNLCVLHQG